MSTTATTGPPLASSPLSHIERTAASPRDTHLHPVQLTHIHPVNAHIRLLTLTLLHPQTAPQILPGQWLDLHIPSLPTPGGFTITSPPSTVFSPSHPYVELAVQASANPPAAWLSRPTHDILGTHLRIRVGGGFVYPPPHRAPETLNKVVMLAGGVGVNPLMAMLSHISERGWEKRVVLLYATRAPAGWDSVLFYRRLKSLEGSAGGRLRVRLFSGQRGGVATTDGEDGVAGRRVTLEDVRTACVGGDGVVVEEGTVVYVCGPQGMTDEFVEGIRGFDGMRREDVMCERWW